MGQLGHGRELAFLAALAAASQFVAVHQTVLPARDNVHFIQLAHRMVTEGFAETVRTSEHHPFYPLTIAAFHSVARRLGFPDEPELWLRCAQVAAALPLVILPLVAYRVGLRLFNPGVAFGAGALVSCLPAVAELGAEGLAEAWYLLFFLLAFLACLEFLNGGGVGWMLASGLASGLAYLARPEGLVVAACALMTLVLMQTLRHWRLPWAKLGLGAAALLMGVAVPAAPYVFMKGGLTDKQSLARALGDPAGDSSSHPQDRGKPIRPLVEAKAGREHDAATVAGTATFANPMLRNFRLAEMYDGVLTSRGEALREFGREFVESLNYVFALAAGIGLLFPAQMKPRRIDILVLVTLVGFSAAIIESASHGGFISTRHLLTPALLAIFWSAHGGTVIARGLAALGRRLVTIPTSPQRRQAADNAHADVHSPSPWQLAAQVAVLAAAVLFCFVETSRPNRGNRLAQIKAAQWLAQNTPSGSVVLDTYGWASLLSNRPSYFPADARYAFRDPRLHYVVAHERFLELGTPQSDSLRALLDAGGQVLVRFPAESGKDKDFVAIYEFSLSRANEQLAGRGDPDTIRR